MGSIWLRLATEERMQNANLSQEISEEPGSRIPDMSTQLSPEPGFVPASIIERAAQRLDWTNPSGMQHSTPRGLEETTNQRPDPPRIAWASWLRSSRSGGPRLLLISRLYVSVLVVVVAGTGIFLLTHSAGEKATAESARATERSAEASEPTSPVANNQSPRARSPANSAPERVGTVGRFRGAGDPKVEVASSVLPGATATFG